MSFLKRLILSICLLLILGVPLSATYDEKAQTFPAQADEDRLVQPDDGTSAVEEFPGAPEPRELPSEENRG